ncbi:MAG: lipoprotein [Methylococcales bacterium]
MKHCIVILLIGISIYGCGQKGDLFLPEPSATPGQSVDTDEKPVDTND